MIKEVVKIRMTGVRSKCIQMDWYTRGTVTEYSNMLEKCVDKENDWNDAPYTIELLEEIAKDIYEHSNPNRWEGYDENPILNIMFELREDACYTYFEEVKEESL